MKCKLFSHTVLAAMSFVGTIGNLNAGDHAAAATPEMTPPGEARSMVEAGRMGAATRRPAREFSGAPITPVSADPTARAGSPDEDAAVPPRAEDAVEIDVPRFAPMTDGEPRRSRSVRSNASGTTDKSVEGKRSIDYNDPRAQMITPLDGSRLLPAQTFEWSPGENVDDYYLQIGSCFECADLLDEEEGQSLQRSVSLPVDGRSIYVTLFSYIDGVWYWIDYQYRAASRQLTAAQMISPVAGSTLSVSQRSVWDAGYGADTYYLRIGSCAGCKDILDENEGLGLSRTAALPEDGRVTYVRLFSRLQGQWWYRDYQYRAARPSSGGTTVRVNVVNSLGYSINVSINGQVIGGIPAYGTAGATVKVASLTVMFRVNQPVLGTRTLGDPMSGVFSTIQNPSGTYTFKVTNVIGGSWFFLPLVTNQTAVPLLIEVNGGLQAENRCNCVAPAATPRVGTGYYRFYSNSNVRLFDDASDYQGAYRYFGVDYNGGVSKGTPLTPYLKADSGVVELVISQAP